MTVNATKPFYSNDRSMIANAMKPFSNIAIPVSFGDFGEVSNLNLLYELCIFRRVDSC